MNTDKKNRLLKTSVSVLIAAALIYLTISMFNATKKSIERENLPRLGQIPEFTLTNQDNKLLGIKDLFGKPYVADFIFTSCPSFCPLITQSMKMLQNAFEKEKMNANFISITVDPETDTPERLLSFSKKYSANLNNWNFLTGPKKSIQDLLEKGFLVGMGEKIVDGNLFDISHSSKFIVVDEQGDIRGIFGSDAAGRTQVISTVKLLLD